MSSGKELPCDAGTGEDDGEVVCKTKSISVLSAEGDQRLGLGSWKPGGSEPVGATWCITTVVACCNRSLTGGWG